MVLRLGVESFVIDTVKGDNPGRSEEVCQGVLNSWLNDEPGTGVAARTWRSVLKALETSGHMQLAERLRREQFGDSSQGPVSEPTSLQGTFVYMFFVIVVHCTAVNGSALQAQLY